jgi:osmotically-inducible protein OsmY
MRAGFPGDERMTQTQHTTDADLKDAVTDELSWTPDVDSTHIGVSVNGGAIALGQQSQDL